MTAGHSLGILGAGAFGTALAVIAAKAGKPVILFARDDAGAETLARTRRSPRLPAIELPPAIDVSADPEMLGRVDHLLLAVPAQATAMALAPMAAHIPPGTALIACAKGFERETGRLQSAIIADSVPQALPAALSGPGFAVEIASGLPTAVTVAAADEDRTARLCAHLSTPTFRPYASNDLVGVEVAGAVKNVLAIACGVAMGRRLGESARAALIARGLAEMTRLGTAMGARPETFLGLAGVGDLVLTATSRQSRNTRFGERLGGGADISELTAPGEPLAEGFHTAETALRLASRHDVDMPIVRAVAEIVGGRSTVEQAIEGLFARPLTNE